MIVILAVLGFAAWVSDFVTMQGERTVYTVECRGGPWQEHHCAGRLTVGKRYRYRALKPHNEVIFWTVGTNEPSGKFGDCKIKDGRNWICKANGDAARSITLQMAEGAPIAGPAGVTREFRAVSKWHWLLLQRGWGGDVEVPAAAAVAPTV
ncbi:MAG: hypothetical protein ACXWCO_01740 [Caldimonas sp.]